MPENERKKTFSVKGMSIQWIHSSQHKLLMVNCAARFHRFHIMNLNKTVFFFVLLNQHQIKAHVKSCTKQLNFIAENGIMKINVNGWKKSIIMARNRLAGSSCFKWIRSFVRLMSSNMLRWINGNAQQQQQQNAAQSY